MESQNIFGVLQDQVSRGQNSQGWVVDLPVDSHASLSSSQKEGKPRGGGGRGKGKVRKEGGGRGGGKVSSLVQSPPAVRSNPQSFAQSSVLPPPVNKNNPKPKPMGKALDLFSGTGSVAQRLVSLAYEVVTLDLNHRTNPTIAKDLLEWNYLEYPPGYFRVIAASVPCAEYFLAKPQLLGNFSKPTI